MADGERFEPTVRFHAHCFSTPVNNIQNIGIIILSGIVGQSTVIIRSLKPSQGKLNQNLISGNIP